MDSTVVDTGIPNDLPAVSTSVANPCPWAKIVPQVETVSLNDVMSEELAFSLQKKEEEEMRISLEKLGEGATAAVTDELADDSADCSNDLLLAQLLQKQFDKEHDDMLVREEKKYNGSSKVCVTFDKYRRHPSHSSSSDDDDFDDEAKRDWDSFERAEKSSPAFGKSGISRQGNVITTKHDAAVCGRKNACKVMALPPGISTGDGGGFDMQLSNHVYNRLKEHSRTEEKRSQKIHEKKEKSTAEMAVDANTRLLLHKLIDRDYLEGLTGCVSTGKESCVFHAYGGHTEELPIPKECAIKVYKTTLNEFKNRIEYIFDDYRFQERFKKQNPRKVIHMWAEKEMHNLKRMHKFGLPCPEVVYLKKHVLIMTFIGNDRTPAVTLKEANLTHDQMSQAYAQTFSIMKRLYKECNLVHADMSEYNLLWHNNQVWVIDVGQAVEPTHSHALEFLLRDCTNISTFFNKGGVGGVLSPKDLFHEICGLNIPGEGAELLSGIQNFERVEELIAFGTSDKSDAFDVLFDKSKSGQKLGVEPSTNVEYMMPSTKFRSSSHRAHQ